MRIVNDVSGALIKPDEVEIGQLINAEPAVFFATDEEGEPVYEGHELQAEKAKAAVILVRMQPRTSRRPPAARTGVSRASCALQDLHPRGLPDLAVGAAEPPPALPLPPVHIRPRGQRQGDLRTRCPFAPQLPMGLDQEGYLVALSDFEEPVGPSYWERGDR